MKALKEFGEMVLQQPPTTTSKQPENEKPTSSTMNNIQRTTQPVSIEVREECLGKHDTSLSKVVISGWKICIVDKSGKKNGQLPV